jgi:hypothetical protein
VTAVDARCDVAAALPVRARTPAEAALLRDSLLRLGTHGLPMVVSDAGSTPEFAAFLAALPGARVVAPVRPGLLGQVQAALRGARDLGARRILYTEPDKLWFFVNRLGDFLAADRVRGGDGVLVAARDDASFATFPAGQRLTERLLRELCADALGTGGYDVTYGPLLLDPALVGHVEAVDDPALGWGWRVFVLAAARRLGMPLRFFADDLPCPPEQRGEDDECSRIYRTEQLAQNVRGLALGLKMPR